MAKNIEERFTGALIALEGQAKYLEQTADYINHFAAALRIVGMDSGLKLKKVASDMLLKAHNIREELKEIRG